MMRFPTEPRFDQDQYFGASSFGINHAAPLGAI